MFFTIFEYQCLKGKIDSLWNTETFKEKIDRFDSNKNFYTTRKKLLKYSSDTLGKYNHTTKGLTS